MNASSLTSSEGKEGHPVCTICQEERRYLKQIPCRHVFCETCLQLLINSTEVEEKFPCPMCRASTSVPVGGASGFETYFEPTASPENIMETTSLKLSANNEAKICRECEEEVTKYICVQCKKAVCTSCAEDHGEDCHTLVLLRGRNLDLERTLQMTNSTKCQKHGKLEMQFYCQTCKEPICEQCKLLRTHHRHAIEDLPESCVRAKESILTSQKRVTSGIRLLETVLSDVERRRSELKRQKSQAEGAICAQAEEACRLVLARKTDALNELTDMVNTIDQQYALESDSVCLSKKSEPDKVGLVNINGHCRRTKLKEIVFSKRTLRAYIKCNVFNKEIVFDVPASVHLHDLYKQNGFVILCKRPLAMDANEDKTIFAVLDDDFRVYIFRRGESLPFSSYPPANSKSVVGFIADVCFYRLADREVLLLADKGHDDLHVVDVQRGVDWCVASLPVLRQTNCLPKPRRSTWTQKPVSYGSAAAEEES
ncbi:hypothetical protein C0Q70_06323 [Pomacea canaliculata]|uniref:RING-type E3 ubiquitin transferase n=1 Tax=Pomacea canaliculata TaxID=400727 RepID=A0A2T7PNR6_POMCA|nr:hypothetical protein C0Q70_06323 [Pomacea canaliculata]